MPSRSRVHLVLSVVNIGFTLRRLCGGTSAVFAVGGAGALFVTWRELLFALGQIFRGKVRRNEIVEPIFEEVEGLLGQAATAISAGDEEPNNLVGTQALLSVPTNKAAGPLPRRLIVGMGVLFFPLEGSQHQRALS